VKSYKGGCLLLLSFSLPQTCRRFLTEKMVCVSKSAIQCPSSTCNFAYFTSSRDPAGRLRYHFKFQNSRCRARVILPETIPPVLWQCHHVIDTKRTLEVCIYAILLAWIRSMANIDCEDGLHIVFFPFAMFVNSLAFNSESIYSKKAPFC
jgi:hypothetical protein